MAYTDATEMLGLVKSLTGINGRDPIIQRKLEDSAGTAGGAKTYRPYFVSAKMLEQNRADQALSAAKGVTFTNLTTMIKSFMEEQASLDRSLGIEVPAGFEAVVAGSPIMSILSS
jgi:hypothetical protein